MAREMTDSMLQKAGDRVAAKIYGDTAIIPGFAWQEIFDIILQLLLDCIEQQGAGGVFSQARSKRLLARTRNRWAVRQAIVRSGARVPAFQRNAWGAAVLEAVDEASDEELQGLIEEVAGR